ncbi:pentapeptide repeat-containing protein [Nocardia sp. NPDC050799]|uniref:pentapeptide repeat-containing protein n=1 Tax=Nocardia sp. NPDC050799 TaxID=3154842 RepID=UPI0033FCB42E
MATTVATIGASTAAVAALWFSGQSLRATNEQHALSQQTAVTDRFRLAAEQLAADRINVRLSGIYLLERLAKDAPADHPTVFELLISFLHTHAEATACTSTAGIDRTVFKDLAEPPDSVPVDVQAALTVIARRDPGHDEFLERPNLRDLCLPAVTFALPGDRSAPLHHADFTRAHLRDATFEFADLTGADFGYADLYGAGFLDATLVGASFGYADLGSARFIGTNLFNAYLGSADLGTASLSYANLNGASLSYANLTGANLGYADLTGADLKGADLTGANLTGIVYDDSTQWPEGFLPPPSS